MTRTQSEEKKKLAAFVCMNCRKTKVRLALPSPPPSLFLPNLFRSLFSLLFLNPGNTYPHKDY